MNYRTMLLTRPKYIGAVKGRPEWIEEEIEVTVLAIVCNHAMVRIKGAAPFCVDSRKLRQTADREG